MEFYDKALDAKPTGVEALTGIGYCYLDAKQFSSAFSKFRTALAVSQRYEPALAGIAETYQQQGNKEQAIDVVAARTSTRSRLRGGEEAARASSAPVGDNSEGVRRGGNATARRPPSSADSTRGRRRQPERRRLRLPAPAPQRQQSFRRRLNRGAPCRLRRATCSPRCSCSRLVAINNQGTSDDPWASGSSGRRRTTRLGIALRLGLRAP